MPNWRRGMLVRSLRGRDAETVLCVIADTSDTQKYLALCDGKKRPLQRPKRKSTGHVEIPADAPYLTEQQLRSNPALRGAIRRYVCGTTRKG
jgi:ribosomal protein L14E/L6E/L27E